MRKLTYLLTSTLACAHPAPPTGHGHGHGDGHGGHPFPHRFDDPDVWAPRFEDPARDGWQKPAEVLASLKLQPTDRVADIGAATGYFPVRVARAQPLAKVYGIDIEPKMTQYLADRAAGEGLSNLKAVLGTPDDPKLPEKVEVVLMVDTYHHVEDRIRYFERLKQQVAADGRLVVIDFRKDAPMGPPPSMRISAAEVVAELKQAGWEKSAEHDFLPYQHFLVFVPVR